METLCFFSSVTLLVIYGVALLHKTVISISKGTFICHSFAHSVHGVVTTVYSGKYLYKLGRVSINTEQPCLGPASSPWLSLLTLFTDSASVKQFPSGQNQNWPPEQNPWRSTSALRDCHYLVHFEITIWSISDHKTRKQKFLNFILFYITWK